ncbi:hypothetical protein RJ639_040186 [Escallonia herrerae]|uniref:Uncharacterized protein n=1 Tax=Escallonia herrerae TaxID=1293975 RepID=A0AA89B5V9_9ASTE|nr:hypothetical protein RJ639_040186 [Escallonia herrerae]
MDSLSSVSPSIVLPPENPLRHRRHHHPRRRFLIPLSSPRHEHRLHFISGFSNLTCCLKPSRSRNADVSCKFSGIGHGEEAEEDEEVERALHLDGTIPGTSDEFVKQVSSRAYDMLLEANPWREPSKAVYVLTQRENQLCTMKTRRNRSEVARELGQLFSKGGKWRNQPKQPEAGSKFQMLVEDISEGVLVFEDENEAAKYCDLLQGGGQGCEGVAEVEASSVFDLCRKMRALAVLFRRGRTHPLPESLKLNLRARKRSLEDQEDVM